ncbi:hypothetical protein SAMN04488109_2345 [Chryseolinea serpens]|uniref:Tetratricopeptide repeat-containing protein n=1 Tax=Chryseolinea serpens TaxID=947013 RepID=A0A1M5NHG9_9BACT|nr:hypothetical protein [Chryseolinea serpens]SHG88978.1 hypothetical protein SAMN04488109_2345 [Chryseolinea serpens]
MKTQKLTLLFALVASFASAQDYAFKVLATKGANEVKSGTDWVPLKTGASLRANDELKISENAYVGLVHSKGTPLELKKAGNYPVKKLEDEIKPSTGVLNKYTDFILSSNSAENKKDRLSATGAVDRGENYAIKLLLPENQYSGIFNNTAIITWDGSKASGPYVVTLKNMFDDELVKFDTPETSFKIDLNDPHYAKENAILVEVYSKADPKQISKQHLIKRLAPAEQATVKKKLEADMSSATEQTALNKYLMAGFYEENKLLIDALSAYKEAIQLAPDVPTYQDGLDEFLLRNNMKK